MKKVYAIPLIHFGKILINTSQKKKNKIYKLHDIAKAAYIDHEVCQLYCKFTIQQHSIIGPIRIIEIYCSETI